MSNIKKISYREQLKEFLDSGTRNAKITKVVLCTLAIASMPVIVGVTVAMGNAVQILKMFDKKKYTKRQISTTLTNLKKRKLIEYISGKNGVTTVKITKNGESILKRFAIDIIKIPKPKKWDGRWRIVMFDLPVRFSKARDSLRFKLKQLGFVQFQKSVWLYPYQCEDEILFVADYYKVSKHIEFLELNSINNDMKFKKHFSLL